MSHTPNAYTELLWSVESAMGDLDEAVRLQPTTVTQSVSGGTLRRQSVSAAFTLDGMTAELLSSAHWIKPVQMLC